MIDYSNRGVVWYVMKTTYQRELKAKAYLDSLSIENFIPMSQKVVTERGVKRNVEEPAIHNLIFVKTDIAQINELKSQLSYLHNYLAGVNDNLYPVIVSEFEMTQFIGAINRSLEKPRYVDITTTQLAKGSKVRITGGPFEGYEGILAKVKGIRDKRVVLSIEGVVAIALTSIDASLIEKI